MKIFRKDLFVKDMVSKKFNPDKIQQSVDSWVKICDGKEAINGEVIVTNIYGQKTFFVHDWWCEEI